ncbi:MAG: glycosyltransferase family 4 protein [Chloroflexi bacterium]|nr:glycosyltransferase family 4 protein [Chloroflexota bacterium]
MRINIIMGENVFSGGHLVTYELANRLASRGNTVTIYYPVVPVAVYLRSVRPAEVKHLLRRVQMQLMAKRPTWFDLRVPLVKVPWVSSRWIRDADVTVAGNWDVLWALRSFPRRKGAKVLHIHDSYQGMGRWSGLARDMYHAAECRIVTTRLLLEEVRSLGLEAECVPNGVDPSFFRPQAPLTDRGAGHIALRYSLSASKGADHAFASLNRVFQSNRHIRVSLFGSAKTQHALAPWMDWKGLVPRDELPEILSRASIFVSPNTYTRKGWSLPEMEAMACGCALASTRHDGIEEYAKDGESALLSPIGDVEALADSISRLIADDSLRLRIARNGLEGVQRFTWDRSAELFEKALQRAYAIA